VEWISNDVPGGRPLVLLVERVWYKWMAPPAGGTPSGGLPQVATASTTPDPGPTAQGLSHLAAPTAVVPIATGPLPQEGQWVVVGRLVGGLPAIRVTYLRPDNVHTSLVTGVMWLDMKLLKATLVPGIQLPTKGASWPGLHFSIPASARADLAATFNSGFLLRDSDGGWYGDGRMAVPLVDGQASLVIYTDGTATVADWGRDASMSANVAAARQNLKLIVDGGRVTPLVAADNYLIWDKTLGNTVLEWRSGVGVTQDGALVYAAGNGLSVESLADVLQRAGAACAMELDINSRWTSANYNQLAAGSSTVVSPTKLVPDMSRSVTRFLVPDERNFVAVFIRSELLPAT